MRTVQEIINSFRNYLINLNSPLKDFREYSNIYIIFRAIALLIVEQDVLLKSHKDSFYVTSSTGRDLDNRAKDFGITRFQGSYAEGFILISSSTNSVIPEGLILTSPTRNSQWEILEDVSVNGFEKIVKIRSIIPGFYNIEAGVSLTSNLYPQVKFIVGVEKTPEGVYVGDILSGSDLESDSSFRNRILNTLRFSNNISKQYLLNNIKSLPNINHAFIKENEEANGIISIYVDSQDSRTKDSIKNIIDNSLVPGLIYLIKPLKISNVNIVAEIKVNRVADLGIIETTIKRNIAEFFNKLEVGKDILAQEIGARILIIPEVIGVEIKEPITNIVPKKDTLFKMNSLTLNYTRENI